MDTPKLKFLLKLLGQEGYRGTIAQLRPNEKTTMTECDRICSSLAEEGIVNYSREVTQFQSTVAGQALLEKDLADAGISEQQRFVLHTCARQSATPSDLRKLHPAERQTVIQALVAQELVQIEKERVKEVWLTEKGYAFLQDECYPSGNDTITLDLVKNYLQFLRRTLPQVGLQRSLAAAATQEETDIMNERAIALPAKGWGELDDQEILDIIKDLDRELGTHNELPIYQVRRRLEPRLSRAELDQVLYRLQQNDWITLSPLVQPQDYTPEEISAGLLENNGHLLFFIQLVSE